MKVSVAIAVASEVAIYFKVAIAVDVVFNVRRF